ncbi:hypothetical protein FRX31_034046 [Thalictrum thalictroides]|uniref:Reverse transcriptase zinc-binding domain-containing protein n=1 Tax=Thalictrum thalictroides TaxID=46969 RepID=A0A7J6UUT7_THATH|nr:hypothetical protein FRX31_034046 [Thalictrum thalictroides]
MIRSKYGVDEHGWWPKRVTQPYGCSLWGDNSGGRWHVVLRRTLREWEAGLLEAMLDRIREFRLSVEEDSWQWRGMAISVMCPLCNLVHESISHLFIHCPVVLNLWSILLRSDQHILLTLYAVDTVEDWLRAWPVKTGNELMVHVWRFLPYAVLRTFWKHMNRKVESVRRSGGADY